MYVEYFIYFLCSDEVEKEFESRLSKLTTVDFMGTVQHFLGIKFQWVQSPSSLTVHLSQPAFTDHILQEHGLNLDSATSSRTPYRSGLPVDSIPSIDMPNDAKNTLSVKFQSLVGSLQWLSSCTRPDIAVITSILAKYQSNPSPGHYDSGKYVLRYLLGTNTLGISFHSNIDPILSTFINFPLPPKPKLSGVADSNWGSQDQSLTNIPSQSAIDLFKSRSISGHVISFHGPLHWTAKRQSVTARSSAEAEIYATDECCKDIIYLSQIIQDLHLQDDLTKDTIHIYNDNMACVQWTHNKTTRNIRHIQLRENDVREAIQQGLVDVTHVAGKDNMADIFTKEDRDVAHYIRMRNILISLPPTSQHLRAVSTKMYTPHFNHITPPQSARNSLSVITRSKGGISSSRSTPT